MSKSIMIQGTMSNAGKSLLTAALCRILKQDGYDAAPFKSQNMALNAAVTGEQLEIGRAQAMQAEAAGLTPAVEMNPILLKPTGDSMSQVIVNGEVYGNMSAREYYQKKDMFLPYVKKAFEKLSARHDIIVIEGAGSPAELNLAKDDFANMGMAKIAKSPVLLVGDIERGGVFAQLIGTLELLPPDEREMVKALVVNKFRGDKTLFNEGVDILERLGKKPVAGVIPYVECDIDDEDSLSEKLKNKEPSLIDIAVIRLPRISNFTDFDVFSQFKGVKVRYAASPEELGNPDLIVLPGTKNTIGDLNYLKEKGIDSRIKQLAAAGTPVAGVCGGMQMLGYWVEDYDKVEGGGKANGLGLLPLSTSLVSHKRTELVKGVVSDEATGFFSCLKGAEFEGYEIHMGTCQYYDKPLLRVDGGEYDGAYTENVMGTYVHGFFDNAKICERLVKALYKRKGLEYGSQRAMSRAEYKETQYDLLADAVRASLDMELIYEIIKEGI